MMQSNRRKSYLPKFRLKQENNWQKGGLLAEEGIFRARRQRPLLERKPKQKTN